MFRERITLKSCALYVLMAAVVLASGVVSVSGQKRRKQPPKYILPEDTIIRLRSNEKLSSKNAQVGHLFTSTVVTPVYVRGVQVIPAGSIVTGGVMHVVRASRKSQAGSLNVTFTYLKLPNGGSTQLTPRWPLLTVQTTKERSRANPQRSAMPGSSVVGWSSEDSSTVGPA